MLTRTKFAFILCFIILTISACSSTQNNTVSEDSGKQNTESTNSTSSIKDKEYQKIHDYMESIWDSYEAKYSVDKAESLVYIDASKALNVTIIEACRAFIYIENKKVNMNMTENEIDVVGMKRLKDLGFKEENGRWSFEGKEVNIGEPLPVPDDMKQTDPEPNKEIDVSMAVNPIISNGMIVIQGTTNLPEGTQLMLSLNGSGYMAQDSVSVSDGTFTSSQFSDKRNSLASGTYTLEISTPTANVQPSSVQEAIGKNGRNLKGSLVTFDEVWGNTVDYKTDIKID